MACISTGEQQPPAAPLNGDAPAAKSSALTAGEHHQMVPIQTQTTPSASDLASTGKLLILWQRMHWRLIAANWLDEIYMCLCK